MHSHSQDPSSGQGPQQICLQQHPQQVEYPFLFPVFHKGCLAQHQQQQAQGQGTVTALLLAAACSPLQHSSSSGDLEHPCHLTTAAAVAQGPSGPQTCPLSLPQFQSVACPGLACREACWRPHCLAAMLLRAMHQAATLLAMTVASQAATVLAAGPVLACRCLLHLLLLVAMQQLQQGWCIVKWHQSLQRPWPTQLQELQARVLPSTLLLLLLGQQVV